MDAGFSDDVVFDVAFGAATFSPAGILVPDEALAATSGTALPVELCSRADSCGDAIPILPS